MKLFDNYEDCCGCGECVNVCPHSAISMNIKINGFLYPSIDNLRCVDCGLCQKKCAFKNNNNQQEPLKFIVAKSKNADVLRNSTSGGMYTLLSDYILKKNGVVYSPSFDSEMRLVHTRISDINQRNTTAGSKYVQSLCSIYNDIVDDAKHLIPIAFFLFFCQVNAL